MRIFYIHSIGGPIFFSTMELAQQGKKFFGIDGDIKDEYVYTDPDSLSNIYDVLKYHPLVYRTRQRFK